MLKNMSVGIGVSLAITGFTSSNFSCKLVRFRGILPKHMHVFGIITGIISGGLYGAITSTKYTLEQF